MFATDVMKKIFTYILYIFQIANYSQCKEVHIEITAGLFPLPVITDCSPTSTHIHTIYQAPDLTSPPVLLPPSHSGDHRKSLSPDFHMSNVLKVQQNKCHMHHYHSSIQRKCHSLRKNILWYLGSEKNNFSGHVQKSEAAELLEREKLPVFFN